MKSLQELAKSAARSCSAPTHHKGTHSILIGYIVYLMRLPPFAYGAGINSKTNRARNRTTATDCCV